MENNGARRKNLIYSICSSQMLVRRVRLRLSDIYTALGDNNAAARQKRAAGSWAAPACARCREPLAERAEPLASLPCAHIVHHA